MRFDAEHRSRSRTTSYGRRERERPTLVVDGPPADAGVRCGTGSGFTLAAAVLGFFVITLDAVVVNVAIPAVRGELGGGISGLQWWSTPTR